jgi:nitroimidazol reductase NimA-like FMN-containing flavoprotein (pyridoxamine 5'-phosphate oxidase superfamily)
MSKQLSLRERKFLEANYISRIATCSAKSVPHISPIYFANDDVSVYFTTATTTQKFKNISENDRVSLVVDEYDADWLHGVEGTKTKEKAVVISGKAESHKEGELYMTMYWDLLRKYPDYRAEQHWDPGDLPIIRVSIRKVVSWGLD